MFLAKADFNAIARDAALEQIAAGAYPPMELVTSERFAIDEATAYLNFKYDTNAIFSINAYNYDIAQAYKTGDVVIDSSGNPYNCIADALAGTTLTDTNFFAVGDLRNGLIVMILADITLYHYHNRTAPNRIPENRIIRYEQAIEKLKEIRKSFSNPDLPLRNYDDPAHTTQQETHTIEVISQEKRNNYF